MNYSTVLPAALLALSLSACDKPAGAPPADGSAAPALRPVGPAGGTGLTGSIESPMSLSPSKALDPSRPAEKPAAPADLPTGSQSKPNPQGDMTKQEESAAMPKPGQANDHSTPVLHPPK